MIKRSTQIRKKRKNKGGANQIFDTRGKSGTPPKTTLSGECSITRSQRSNSPMSVEVPMRTLSLKTDNADIWGIK
jgi:hypothetical protein